MMILQYVICSYFEGANCWEDWYIKDLKTHWKEYIFEETGYEFCQDETCQKKFLDEELFWSCTRSCDEDVCYSKTQQKADEVFGIGNMWKLLNCHPKIGAPNTIKSTPGLETLFEYMKYEYAFVLKM